MTKLWLALGLLLCLGLAPAQAQDTQKTPAYCNKSFQVNQGAVALTKIVSGIANQSIGLCGLAADNGAAASTIQLQYGTGTNCGTGGVVLYPVVTMAVNATYVDHVPFVNLSIPSVNSSGVANDLCLVTTGTGPVSIIVYYAQF